MRIGFAIVQDIEGVACSRIDHDDGLLLYRYDQLFMRCGLNSSGTPSAREEVLELIEEIVDLKRQNLHLCVVRPAGDRYPRGPRAVDESQDFSP
jgi:hypothetical protein